MQKGKNFILQIKNIIYSKAFQRIHCVGKNSFTRTRKLPFSTVFSMILKLVKK
ncbi:IS4 family transposase, partial [Wolbachia endosymbiont of Drosophila bocki]|nr:IS4 family transposase [Wolbachia endosymbiont of Drosophila bocki]MDE5067549.1 IS4 family transposase [Wolbachia endosymbiont of Drosophila leontia]